MEAPAIQDQRTMTGDRPHETVESVRAYWRMWGKERGFKRDERTVRDLDDTELASDVYISAGCYVVDCPGPGCNGAAAVWVENPEACCLDCGRVFKPRWPTAGEIGGTFEEAVAVLALRPKRLWRNFRAGDKAETVADLKAQNLAVGDAIPGGQAASGPHPLDPRIVR